MAETALEERMAKIEGAFTQIDQRLGRVEIELVELRRQMNEELGEVRREIKSLRDEMHSEIGSLRDEMHSKIDSLYHMTLYVLIPMWVTIIGALIGVALTR